MATSFAAYASQFLNRQQNGGTSSLTSSQPMFFSFTTDDGSRAGNSPDSDLDDLDDPHLRGSDMSRAAHEHQDLGADEDDEDPYLRLDEDEHPPRFDPRNMHSTRYESQSVPLISSEYNDSERADSPKGWLAHQASPLRPSRSPSPSRSSSSSSASSPPDLFIPAPPRTHTQRPHPPPPSTNRAPISLSLTESLLPRDGLTRPLDVFSLPDPRHTPRGRRKYNDSIWTAIWCTGLLFCLVSSILVLFLTHKPTRRSRTALPYTTLLHTVPMLTILTFLSAGAAYAHVFLLRIFVRPVMIATSVFIPATLFISAVWAFIGSFMWDGDVEPTWGETVGLRLFSLVPLALSILTARRLLHLPRAIHTTSSTLTLTTHLLISNPFLLALSPAILLLSLLASIPFLTLVFRLLLIGQFERSPPAGSGKWRIEGWANWAIVLTVGVWLWSWGVARGILKMTCAGVIGAWYFADPDAPPHPPASTHTLHAALFRSAVPSLGTIVLSSLLLTLIRLLALITILLQRIPIYLARLPAYVPFPVPSFLVSGGLLRVIAWAVGALEGVTTALSGYALVYTGLTGDPFMVSARRARALTSGVEERDAEGRMKKRFRNEPPLTLLTVAPLTLTFPFALITYLFVAHTLDAPEQALGASMLAGGVTALVGLFCVGLVKDTADTLYICYCIDKDVGQRRREEVFAAFEYETRAQTRARQAATPSAPQPHIQSPRPGQNRTAPLQQKRHQPYPEPRQPLQPPIPSPTPTPTPAAIVSPPRQLTQPPPPPQPANDDDLDPFEQSYLRDNSQLLGSPPRRSPPPPLPPQFSLAHSRNLSQTHSRSHSRTHSRTHSQTQPRLATSAELNRKPLVASEVRPYSTSPEPIRVLKGGNDGDEHGDGDGDGDGDGSQFFPGSGFF